MRRVARAYGRLRAAGVALTSVFAALLVFSGCEFLGRPADTETPDTPEEEEETVICADFDYDLSLISSEDNPNVLSARLQFLRGSRSDIFTVSVTPDRSSSSAVRLEGRLFHDTTVVFVPLPEFHSGWHRVDVSAVDTAGFETSKGMDFHLSTLASDESAWTVSSLYVPETSVTLTAGASAEVTAEWYPSRPEPSLEDWSWTAEPEGVADVTHWGQTARITGVAPGSAAVTVTCRGASAKIDVTVTAAPEEGGGEEEEKIEVGSVEFSVSDRSDFAWTLGRGTDILAAGPVNAGTLFVRASGQDGLSFDFSGCASLCGLTARTDSGSPFSWTASMGAPGEGTASVTRTVGEKTATKSIPVLTYGTVTVKAECSWSGLTKKRIAESLALGFRVSNAVSPSLTGSFTVNARISAVTKDDGIVHYDCAPHSVARMSLHDGAECSWSVSSDAWGLMDALEAAGYGITDLQSLTVLTEWTADLSDPFVRAVYSGGSIEGVNAVTAGTGTTQSLDGRLKSFLGIE